MNSGVNIDAPAVVAAFKATLIHQGVIAVLIFAVLGLAWVSARAWAPIAAGGAATEHAGQPTGSTATEHAGQPTGSTATEHAGQPTNGGEPAGRMVLRVGFGLLWLFDGILQAQPKMAIGLPSQVIGPTAATSPSWVQHVVNWAGTAWSYHPMQAGASAVWIQVGVGVWLLATPRGSLSRLAGVASVGWGLVVWVFGESFGGIFAPGLTWLFGAPGAAGLYAVAGALIALPERGWHAPRLGRLTLAGLGLFLTAMAVLQAWPGRGFWSGGPGGGTLTGMVRSMEAVPQPHFLAAWVHGFASVTAAQPAVVNLAAVLALAVTGAAFLSGRPALIRPALAAFTVVCLADWVFVEDLGFLGGLGTDPNSMIPFVLLAVAGYLALTRSPEPATEPSAASVAVPWRERLAPTALRRVVVGASFQSVAAVGAVGVIILGAAPMMAAQANPVADPILAQAIDGSSAPLDVPAPAFKLTDQHGRIVTLAALRGKVVLLTFLDDTCSVDCPLIAQEFREAGQLLGADAGRVELVAINYNPLYTAVSYIQAFDRQEGLAGVPDWLFLTGPLAQLRQIWHRYLVPQPEVLAAGSMVAHGDYAFVLDQHGHLRQEMSFNTGPGSQATKSSFAAELTDAARQLLAHP